MQLLKSNEYVKVDGDRFDVLKFILSVFIVGIHTSLFYPLIPVFRLGVPTFFIMTSYFFFLKQNSLSSHQEKRNAMKKYCKRILLLYLFWFIILLPLTIYYRCWYVDVGFSTIFKVIHSFIFSSTFKASWFLMASLLVVLLVWFLAPRVRMGILITIGLFFYVVCCLTSNYYNVCESIPYFADAYKTYVSVFFVPYNSFPVAFIFVLAGKYLADHTIIIPNNYLCLIFVLSLILLYVEFFFLSFFGVANANNDCYFSLLPLSIALFMLIGQNYISVGANTTLLRKGSTIIFCAHCSLAPIVSQFVNYSMPRVEVFYNYDLRHLLVFIITLLLCLALCKYLLWLETQEHFKFVRYSH